MKFDCSIRRLNPWRASGRIAGYSLLAVNFFLLSSGRAASYTFVSIADTTGAFSSCGIPSINASGLVAFQATLDAGGSGIYKGNGGSLTTVAVSAGEPFSSFGGGGTPINDSGTVAFLGNLDAGGSGIYKGDGGLLTTITLAAPTFAAFPITLPVSINAAGTVAFSAMQGGGTNGIFIGNGGPVTPVYLSPETPFLGFESRVMINDSGVVVFSSFLDEGGSGLFTGNGGPTTSIALSSGPYSDFSGFPSINESGAVAFDASLDGGDGGLFVGDGATTTTIVLTSAPVFSTILVPSLNNAGQVAFLADTEGGAEGIFVGADPVADKVIRVGDALFGSTVTVLNFSRSGLNDAGEIVFNYRLADSRVGIAVARPPVIRILSIERLLNGTVHLEVSGAPNLIHTIQATTNLAQSFAPIGTQTAAANGQFSFDDTNASPFDQRFYRVALP